MQQIKLGEKSRGHDTHGHLILDHTDFYMWGKYGYWM